MSNVATNPITGDEIKTKVVSDQYRNNFDAIFRKPINNETEVNNEPEKITD
jgi:hypothetical protein